MLLMCRRRKEVGNGNYFNFRKWLWSKVHFIAGMWSQRRIGSISVTIGKVVGHEDIILIVDIFGVV